MQQKIVLIGGPGTGKSSILNELIARGFHCMPEVSREVILEAQKKGIEQLFLTEPLLFSKMLFEGREKQYAKAVQSKADWVFFDRGLPDVFAYLDYSKDPYPGYFQEKSEQYKYNHVFAFAPWKKIYASDNERYESYEESVVIDQYIRQAYKGLGYKIIQVPFGSVKERCDFIINWLNINT